MSSRSSTPQVLFHTGDNGEKLRADGACCSCDVPEDCVGSVMEKLGAPQG